MITNLVQRMIIRDTHVPTPCARMITYHHAREPDMVKIYPIRFILPRSRTPIRLWRIEFYRLINHRFSPFKRIKIKGAPRSIVQYCSVYKRRRTYYLFPVVVFSHLVNERILELLVDVWIVKNPLDYLHRRILELDLLELRVSDCHSSSPPSGPSVSCSLSSAVSGSSDSGSSSRATIMSSSSSSSSSSMRSLNSEGESARSLS